MRAPAQRLRSPCSATRCRVKRGSTRTHRPSAGVRREAAPIPPRVTVVRTSLYLPSRIFLMATTSWVCARQGLLSEGHASRARAGTRQPVLRLAHNSKRALAQHAALLVASHAHQWLLQGVSVRHGERPSAALALELQAPTAFSAWEWWALLGCWGVGVRAGGYASGIHKGGGRVSAQEMHERLRSIATATPLARVATHASLLTTAGATA